MIIWVMKIPFVQFFCVFLPPLLKILCFYRSISFLSFIEPIFAWNVPLISLNFLEEISSLSHSVAFLYFFALITEDGFLISLLFETLHSDGYIFPFCLCLLLLFFPQLFIRHPQTTILPFFAFFLLGMVLITASCTISWTSIYSSSGTLSDLMPWIYLSLPLDLGHTWTV